MLEAQVRRRHPLCLSRRSSEACLSSNDLSTHCRYEFLVFFYRRTGWTSTFTDPLFSWVVEYYCEGPALVSKLAALYTMFSVYFSQPSTFVRTHIKMLYCKLTVIGYTRAMRRKGVREEPSLLGNIFPYLVSRFAPPFLFSPH